MGTREENLKKINEETEKLDDEQLDKVTGGNVYQSLMDERFFMSIGIKMFVDYDPKVDPFSMFGVEVTRYGDDLNEYRIIGADGKPGKKCQRESALGYVLSKVNYPGYNGKWWDVGNTTNFILNNLGHSVV